ncbi:MAG: adenylate/guanylate cyclase domain-containing protein [Myxococcales bacterium]|nr:adenylate/guanylate cyclase domain-containing protein [Myxococcales bacterium]
MARGEQGAKDSGSQLIGDFLVRAQQTGEVSVSIARIVLCLAFLAMHLPFRLELMIAGDPKSWILIGGFLIGLGFSFMSLRWGRLGSVSPRRVYLSVAVDAFLVYVTIASGVIWPHEGYIGLLREHEPAIVYLAIVASGLRLSEQGAIFGAVIHGLGLVGLLILDRALWGDALRYTSMEIVFAGAFAVVASIIAYWVAHRTRTLVRQGASAAVLAERARQRLGVYVSEAIADNALGTAELELGGATRRAAILFSDLRGFTRYAERLPPERLVEELNAYLKAMVEAIKGEGGVVDKYIGDAVMAVFGLPNERPGEAARAIRAAAAMNAALADHNRERAARGLPPLAHGIGVHYGPMVAGNIGTPERMQYTVIGDVVNLASRLESATKEEHVDVLISADAVAAAEEAAASGQTIPPLRRHGSLTVRGREQSLEVFTLA